MVLLSGDEIRRRMADRNTTKVAQAIGVHHITLYKFLNQPDRGLSQKVHEKLSNYLVESSRIGGIE